MVAEPFQWACRKQELGRRRKPRDGQHYYGLSLTNIGFGNTLEISKWSNIEQFPKNYPPCEGVDFSRHGGLKPMGELQLNHAWARSKSPPWGVDFGNKLFLITPFFGTQVVEISTK